MAVELVSEVHHMAVPFLFFEYVTISKNKEEAVNLKVHYFRFFLDVIIFKFSVEA